MNRELDVKVATALGWQPRTVSEYPFGDGTFVVYDGPDGECMKPGISYRFSDDIAAAWQVVEWMRKRQQFAQFTLFIICAEWDEDNVPQWQAQFCQFEQPEGAAYREYMHRNPSAPEAICLAFLKAMGVEVDDTVTSDGMPQSVP